MIALHSAAPSETKNGLLPKTAELIFVVLPDEVKLSTTIVESEKLNPADGVPSMSCDGVYNCEPAEPDVEKIITNFIQQDLAGIKIKLIPILKLTGLNFYLL